MNPDVNVRLAAGECLTRLVGTTLTEQQVSELLDVWMLESDEDVRDSLADALVRPLPPPADKPLRSGTERGAIFSLHPAARASVGELAKRISNPAAFAAKIPKDAIYEEIPLPVWFGPGAAGKTKLGVDYWTPGEIKAAKEKWAIGRQRSLEALFVTARCVCWRYSGETLRRPCQRSWWRWPMKPH